MAQQPMSRAVLASDLADLYREIIAPEFDRICDRLDRMDARFDEIDARFDDLLRRFDRLGIPD